jgi:hypothetical protein
MYSRGFPGPRRYQHVTLPTLELDGLERFLVALFLRRYVTYCVRRRRFDAANEAAYLFRKTAATR